MEWYRKDGDNVKKGLQFGKVHGILEKLGSCTKIEEFVRIFHF